VTGEGGQARRFVLCILWALGLLFGISVGPGHAGGQVSVPKPFPQPDGFSVGVREELVREPVFGGHVLIREAGDGQRGTIVLIHGVGDEGSAVWDGLLPVLARDYRVVACDLPGFGRSSKANLLYSPERYTAFLRWLVASRVQGPYVVVGHSLGGALALHFAATRPEGLQRLVLVNVAGILHRTALTRFMIHLKIGKLQDREAMPAPLAWLGRLFGKLVEKMPEPPVDLDAVLERESLREKVLGGDPAKIAGLALVQANFAPVLERVSVPSYLLWGEDDRVAPLRTGRLLAARLPEARLKVIPGGGHVPMTLRPALFEEALRGALSAPFREPDQKEIPGDRVGLCRDQEAITFTGSYRRIEVERCRKVRLVGVAAAEVKILGSEVSIENSRIVGEGVGLAVTGSRVTATALDIRSDVGIESSASTLDLAGVRIEAASRAVRGLRPSRLLFSVSRVDSPDYEAYFHGPWEVSSRQPL